MLSRSESLELASSHQFDLVVIGGGIAGAGIAQNAASRGLSVVLVEKDDFASGTSSRTTKLIHGGLRYLEQFRIKLTRKLCQERSLLERLAPHMVREFSFLLPLVSSRPLFNARANVGLLLYDLVASNPEGYRCQRLSNRAVFEMAPALSGLDIAGGLRFHDSITDDARIVLTVLKSACQEGALSINYLEVRSFIRQDDRICGVVCHDRIGGDDFTIQARACVNATGVWADRVCQLADPGWRNLITASKGVHIMVPASAFETNTALFLPGPDGRYVFVVPWQRALMVGTTDTLYTGNPDKPLANADEVDYLLAAVNSYTRTHRLNRSSVTATFAGLRALLGDASGKSPGSMSREHLVFDGPDGLLSVAGGKLTGYRLVAEEVVNRLAPRLPTTPSPSHTASIMLGGWRNKQDFLSRTAAISAHARRLGIEPATLDHLIANYGADAACVVELVEKDSRLGERILPDFPPIMAEVAFCATCEMAVCLGDVLFRRLRLAVLNQKQCLEAAPRVAKFMASLLGWDERRLALELTLFEKQIREHLEPVTEVSAEKP